MKRLFVGQRVRILYSRGWSELAGQEGRIVGESVISVGPGAGNPGWLVAPDSWGTPVAPNEGEHGGKRFCARSDQLEPILPEGHKPAELTMEELLPFLKEKEKVTV